MVNVDLYSAIITKVSNAFCSGTGPWMNGHFATAACQDGFGLA